MPLDLRKYSRTTQAERLPPAVRLVHDLIGHTYAAFFRQATADYKHFEVTYHLLQTDYPFLTLFQCVDTSRRGDNHTSLRSYFPVHTTSEIAPRVLETLHLLLIDASRKRDSALRASFELSQPRHNL